MLIIIFSVILVICQAVIFLFPPLLPPGLHLPFLVKLLPLLALVVLWSIRLLFHGKRGASAFKVILWALFAFISLVALLETEFSMFALTDREKREAPVIIGNATNSKTVTLVYHPGGTSLLRTVNNLVAEELSQNGFRVTLSTAQTGLKINPQPGSILGFASPVYFGTIRPPLKEFIRRTDLTGVKCFVILTGSVDTEVEVENLKKIIESKGGVFLGGRKFLSTAPPQAAVIEAFVDSIIEK